MSFNLARGNRLVSVALLAGLSLLVWAGSPSYGTPGEVHPAGPTAERAWQESIGLIRQGRFEDAATSLNKLHDSNAAVGELAKWLDKWNEQVQMRAEMTLADYEKYVELAKKYHGKDDLPKALEYTMRALNNAVSKEAFRKEPWVRKMIDDGMKKAAELRAGKEWLDALSIYSQIGWILERDPSIRRLQRECRTHARLDAVYDEDNDWEDRLVGIEQKMVEEAFREINHNYVEVVDWRKVTETGLEQMLLLTESATIREVFEVLQDDLERGAFEARIRANLAKVRNLDKVDFKVARAQFRNALRINRQTIQLPKELIINEYMEGCLEQLDEFTNMIWPKQMPEFEKHTRGDFKGVGISIRRKYNPELKDYEVMVVSPIEDSPAYDAGIQARDIITKVNGESILGLSLSKVVETITGPLGTSVTLGIRRESEPEELEFTLKRDNIKINSIKGFARDPVNDQKWQYMLDPEQGIAYVRVTNFQDNTVEDFKKTLDQLAQRGLRGLVLDLRFDPGGLLRSAVQFSELFLEKNEKIVSTRGLHSREWPIAARRRGPYRDLPLVVLVNDSSASASEIVAGAIKDHGRGIIVGERTFGKFSVQNLIQLAGTNAHLKLTTARYYLPNGECLHRDEDSEKWGVEPNISISLVSKEVAKIAQGFRKRDIIGTQADDLAQKMIADEEADIKAEVQRAKEKAAESKDAKTTAPAEETPTDHQPTKSDDDAQGDSEKDEIDEEEQAVNRNDRPDIDPQLDAALLVMRAHLLDLSYQMVARTGTPPKNMREK